MLVQRSLIRSCDLRIPAREHHVNDCLYRSIDRLCLTESFISVCVCVLNMSRLVFLASLLASLCGVSICTTVNEDCRQKLTKLDPHMSSYIGYV